MGANLAEKRVSGLLYGRRRGPGPQEQKIGFPGNLRRDLVDPLDNNHLPLWMTMAADLTIDRPASIGFVPGLAEGEMVHRYLLSGLNDEGEVGEMVFLRDCSCDYLTFSYDHHYRKDKVAHFGGRGEEALLRTLAEGYRSGQELTVEFVSDCPEQTRSIIDHYGSEAMRFGASELGVANESQSSLIGHLFNQSDGNFSDNERSLVFELETPQAIAAADISLLERLGQEIPLYLNLSLADLARDKGWR